MRLGLALFGGFEARLSSGASVTLHTKKAQALLAYCATHPGQPQSREKLATLLWGNREADHARNSLRQTLFILRAGLPPGVFHVDGDTIAINPRTVHVDVADFERWAVAGTASRLEEAARLYKGTSWTGSWWPRRHSRTGSSPSGSACGPSRWTCGPNFSSISARPG